MATTVDPLLIAAVDDAMFSAVLEEAHKALLAAVEGEELPSHPEILLHAFYYGAEELTGFWENLADGVAQLVSSGERSKFEDSRMCVTHMRRAADTLLSRLLAEINECVDDGEASDELA